MKATEDKKWFLAMKQEIKDSFDVYRNEDDHWACRMALKDGERKLQSLRSILGHHGNEEDSWMNIQDEEDKRGRVGKVWPWERHDPKTSNYSVHLQNKNEK